MSEWGEFDTPVSDVSKQAMLAGKFTIWVFKWNS